MASIRWCSASIDSCSHGDVQSLRLPRDWGRAVELDFQFEYSAQGLTLHCSRCLSILIDAYQRSTFDMLWPPKGRRRSSPTRLAGSSSTCRALRNRRRRCCRAPISASHCLLHMASVPPTRHTQCSPRETREKKAATFVASSSVMRCVSHRWEASCPRNYHNRIEIIGDERS